MQSDVQSEEKRVEGGDKEELQFGIKMSNFRKYGVPIIIVLSIAIIIAVVSVSYFLYTQKCEHIKHFYYGGYNVNGDCWIETNNDSMIRFNDDDYGEKSAIYRFASARTFDWEVNDNLELIITYGTNAEKTYKYSDEIDDSNWFYNEEKEILYLGTQLYRPVEKEEVIVNEWQDEDGFHTSYTIGDFVLKY